MSEDGSTTKKLKAELDSFFTEVREYALATDNSDNENEKRVRRAQIGSVLAHLTVDFEKGTASLKKEFSISDQPSSEGKNKRRSGAKKKDPTAPKRPPSGYRLFATDLLKTFLPKKVGSSGDEKKIPPKDRMKIGGEAWKKLSSDEQNVWNKKAEAYRGEWVKTQTKWDVEHGVTETQELKEVKRAEKLKALGEVSGGTKRKHVEDKKEPSKTKRIKTTTTEKQQQQKDVMDDEDNVVDRPTVASKKPKVVSLPSASDDNLPALESEVI